MYKIIIIFVHIYFWMQYNVNGVKLVAYISQNGLHGEIMFSPMTSTTIKIESNLETTLQYPDQVWSWGVHQFPVDYTNMNSQERCQDLGQQLFTFDNSLGYLILPGNESTTWEYESSLSGPMGLWGKSLRLYNSDASFIICATITTADPSTEHISEARFRTPIGGSIYFRWLAPQHREYHDTLIYTNLYHLQKSKQSEAFTKHSWKIYVTDIFDSDNDQAENNCNVLQLVFDQDNKGSGKAIGDIDVRLGNLNISNNIMKYSARQLYHDKVLELLPSDIQGPQRQLYIVVFDDTHTNNFLGCAKIRPVRPRVVKTIINSNGIKAEMKLKQRHRFEPVWLNISITAANNKLRDNTELARDIAGINIRTLPPDPVLASSENHCSSCGPMFNPTAIELEKVPPAGFGTQDQYAVGDLSGKLLNRNKNYTHHFFIDQNSAELNGIYWDVFLAIQGENSIVHRGLAIHKYNREDSATMKEVLVACGYFALFDSKSPYQIAMRSAQVLFRYPIVGKILLRQPRDEPWADTTIIVEYLIHADGAALNNSQSHRWGVHAAAPGIDFYNWTGRCLSTLDTYNPYKVYFDKSAPADRCNQVDSQLCRLGDLSNRLGTLSIAGRKAERTLSRTIFNDQHLPLGGVHSVVGKSMVIFDDNGPVARGDRLACSIIGGHHWRKAVARDWYANGVPLTVTGKLEFLVQSEYDLTNVEISLKGLSDNGGYGVHVAPVDGSLEFPCEDSSLIGPWNPTNFNERTSPAAGTGSFDQYEIGDLSGKYGTLEGKTQYLGYFNDSNLSLFGYSTVLGRSIAINKKDKMLRWSCSTIERGYSPSEARELRAIASFHHPLGYAYGYIRFTQLIHNDGSQSDTVIEVNLRHPGKNDRNMTRNHHWNIFVNPVGVDATVQQTATRCVAGGYIWNPFYTQLADPLNTDLYREECGPDNPLRCYVGDVSTRVGTIDLGGKRSVFSDPNFPLEGKQTALGRSIVIFGPNYSNERFACANIEPDHHITKYINLQKPPKFVVAQFLEDVRQVMGLPEWMLNIDSRKTKNLHNGACIQMIVQFKGANAHKIEQDFSKLISSGRLNDPSIAIPGYINQKRKVKLSYRTCGVRDPNEKNKKERNSFGSSGSNGRKTSALLSFLVAFYLMSLLFL